MKKWKLIVGILLLAVSVYLCQITGNYLLTIMETKGKAELQKKTIVIDAGHGASDPGKVSATQILEKDINLIIAKQLQELCEKNDIKVIMTREKDTSMGNSKNEDLRYRVDLINKVKPDLAISIHQNSYTAEDVKGAQVFYHQNSEKGEEAARILQESLRKIDSENTRQAKADASYYLLKNTETPLVIIECGFLSNVQEAQKLNSEDYQKKIAEAICLGVLEYLKTYK